MDRLIYDRIRDLEADHWWFVGRRQILRGLLRRIGTPAGAKILEVGCGAGGNVPLLRDFGAVTALEPDDESRAYASQRLGLAVDLPYNAGDYRLMDRRVVEVLKQLPERNRFMKGLFAWVGFNQVAVPYVRPERAAGTTSFRYWKLWNFALDGITSFSSVPIRIWSYVGLIAGVLACGVAGMIVVRTLLFGRDVPGYPSLMVVILMGFGLQMLAIGSLGEYVARIYQEVKNRPLYVVMDRYGFDA